MKLWQTRACTVTTSMTLAIGFAGALRSQNRAGSGPAPEIVVYASDLTPHALSEFEFLEDPASPRGRMVGTPNRGDELDPPPENDPNVTFTLSVRAGIPYRAWVHMKVGPPRGISTANKLWAQFSDAVDRNDKEVLRPRSRSYLTAQGPARQGWTWVGFEMEGAGSPESSLIYFRASGEVTVRVQAGMEGVGFDQIVLSPARFLRNPPSGAIVPK